MTESLRQLLVLADAYEAAEKIGDTTLSYRVFRDSKKLAAIRNGADVQSRRLEAAFAWFALNWPAGLAWPSDIKRAFDPSADKEHRAEVLQQPQQVEG